MYLCGEFALPLENLKCCGDGSNKAMRRSLHAFQTRDHSEEHRGEWSIRRGTNLLWTNGMCGVGWTRMNNLSTHIATIKGTIVSLPLTCFKTMKPTKSVQNTSRVISIPPAGVLLFGSRLAMCLLEQPFPQKPEILFP
jgi:hypothetical protein